MSCGCCELRGAYECDTTSEIVMAKISPLRTSSTGIIGELARNETPQSTPLPTPTPRPAALLHLYFHQAAGDSGTKVSEAFSSSSCPQPFGHHRPVSWKTILPWFQDDSSILHLLCTLFLFLLHQLHLRSSDNRSWRLGTPALKQ